MNPGEEPIEDDEILYRRVPAVWFDGNSVDEQVFLPHPKNDPDGLSLSRAKYKSIEEAAKPPTLRPGKIYYVARLRARALHEADLSIEPKPLEDDPGHCILPDLRSENRGSDETSKLAIILVRGLTSDDIEGPFGPFA